MDIFERYHALTDENKWEEALPIIQEIIDMNPEITTSWFNYGVCLQALKKYDMAAGAFQQAYFRTDFSGGDENEINLGDAAQFRMCYNLLQAGMHNELFGIFKHMIEQDPENLDVILSIDDFKPLFEEKPFSDLLPKH